ncbi:uncharacterized protein K489DRAFT_373489 [Dissoconium aciculare CBS 342.82]|uniref:C2H2-type domain-containing protein n=1 Tax=Dissoconium aciculare CBS 342.82 TaxID=1314786 RepID=A0A6J3LV58_9PEZI|nr:uncharacterized protein K489DRAFT_373489 [Dissoconium aciculare CBS 342.82]KAF1819650.1 hypothetical protein K489DRAFT_373489 [Dissoconium aciculare CBS 342.82]
MARGQGSASTLQHILQDFDHRFVVPEEQSLAYRSRKILDALESLAGNDDMKVANDRKNSSLSDVLKGFKIWSDSVGALYDADDPKSLEYQVKSTLKLRLRLFGLLGDLRDDLQDFQLLSRDEAPVVVDESPDLDASLHDVLQVNLINGLRETMRWLFKTSDLAIEQNNCDGYDFKVAEIEQDEVSDDLDHIFDLFPRLRQTSFEWLRLRLAKASKQRLKWLRCCIALADDTGLHAAPSEISISPAKTRADPIERHGTRRAVHDKVVAADMSLTDLALSAATLMPQALRVSDLRDVSNGEAIFTCPCCCKAVSFTSQSEWVSHVFSDLKAYVCLEEHCGVQLFETSDAWLDHYLSNHFKTWLCLYCHDEMSFDHLDEFEGHLHKEHAWKFNSEQINQICKISEQEPAEISASACHICEWKPEVQRQRPNRDLNSPLRDMVSLEDLKKHVGSHMEQMALTILVPNCRTQHNPLEEKQVILKQEVPSTVVCSTDYGSTDLKNEIDREKGTWLSEGQATLGEHDSIIKAEEPESDKASSRELAWVNETLKWRKRNTQIKDVYRCGVGSCERSYERRLDRNRHRRAHFLDNQRPYPCSKCERGFLDSEDLRRHLRGLHHLDDTTAQQLVLEARPRVLPPSDFDQLHAIALETNGLAASAQGQRILEDPGDGDTPRLIPNEMDAEAQVLEQGVTYV